MSKEIKNITASIRARLLKISKESGVDYNSILRRYFQERFLFRLSKSKYRNHLILKGALLLVPYKISKFRPTRDIDFLGNSITADLEDFTKIINEITDIEDNDGVEFLKENVTAIQIKEEADYHGIRLTIPCKLDTIKTNIQIDIGFGDTIIEGPDEMDFPVLLDSSVPNIKVYSIESSLAEKFEAMVKLNIMNSRMKDFYDVLFFAGNRFFNSSNLLLAIKATFSNRKTDIHDRIKIYSDEFKSDSNRQKLWTSFLTTNNLDGNKLFVDVINEIGSFIEPLFKFNESKTWNPEKWKWE